MGTERRLREGVVGVGACRGRQFSHVFPKDAIGIICQAQQTGCGACKKQCVCMQHSSAKAREKVSQSAIKMSQSMFSAYAACYAKNQRVRERTRRNCRQGWEEE